MSISAQKRGSHSLSQRNIFPVLIWARGSSLCVCLCVHYMFIPERFCVKMSLINIQIFVTMADTIWGWSLAIASGNSGNVAEHSAAVSCWEDGGHWEVGTWDKALQKEWLLTELFILARICYSAVTNKQMGGHCRKLPATDWLLLTETYMCWWGCTSSQGHQAYSLCPDWRTALSSHDHIID